MAVFGHERARRAQGHAGSAKSAARFLQGFFVGRGRAGPQAPVVVINGADGHKLVVGPDALSANNALGQVPHNKRIGLLEPRVVGHAIKSVGADPEFGGQEPQLAAVSLVAHNARFRVVGHEEAHDVRAVPAELGSVCLDSHAGCNRGDAGGHDPAAFFILHHAEPASPGRFEMGMMTQGWDLDAVFNCRLENAGPGLSDDGNSVDMKAYLFHVTPISAWLRQDRASVCLRRRW